MRIFTVGYQGRSLEELVRLLRSEGVEAVVDVRSAPSSVRREFDRANLESFLPPQGIDYFHLPQLGGLREGTYQEHMGSEEFRRGMEGLQGIARERSTAIMCMEPRPSSCHRRFIAIWLKELGWEVIHLVRGGRQSVLDLE
ncbi:MAG: DUF488 family protein [Methanomassiliicoccales archaeon]